MNNTEAPETYDEFFRNWYPYVRKLVDNGLHTPKGSFLVPRSYVEDVTSEIVMRFFEHRVLEQYDPGFEGRTKPIPFRIFLTGFVFSYLKGHSQKIARYRRRELLWSDSGDWFHDHAFLTWWAEVYGGIEEFETELVESLRVLDLIKRTRDYINAATSKPVGIDSEMVASVPDTDLLDTFDAVMAQVLDIGEVNFATLSRQLGCAVITVHNRLKRIRRLMAQVMGRPAPPDRVYRPNAGPRKAA